MRNHSRRTILATGMATVFGGCVSGVSDDRVVTPNGSNVTVHRTGVEEEGQRCLRIENSDIAVSMTDTHDHPLAGADAIETPSSAPVTRPISVRPKSPVSTTESVQPRLERTVTFDVERGGGEYGQYHLKREYEFNGKAFEIEWRVTVPSGYPLVLLSVTFRNQGPDQILLDQDEGDTHDGIQVLSGIGLVGQENEMEQYQFAVGGGNATSFLNQPIFQTYPSVRYVTVFDGTTGATFGLIRGDTGPRMAVINSHSIDLLANEDYLGVGNAISYNLFGALHPGGDTAPREGTELYQNARDWDWGSLTPSSV